MKKQRAKKIALTAVLVCGLSGMSAAAFVSSTQQRTAHGEAEYEPTPDAVVLALADLGLDAKTLAALGITVGNMPTVFSRTESAWEDIAAWRTAESDVVDAKAELAMAVGGLRGQGTPGVEDLTADETATLAAELTTAQTNAKTRRIALRRTILNGFATEQNIDKIVCDDAVCRALPAPLRLAVGSPAEAAKLSRALAVEAERTAESQPVPTGSSVPLQLARTAYGVPQAQSAMDANTAAIEAQITAYLSPGS